MTPHLNFLLNPVGVLREPPQPGQPPHTLLFPQGPVGPAGAPGFPGAPGSKVRGEQRDVGRTGGGETEAQCPVSPHFSPPRVKPAPLAHGVPRVPKDPAANPAPPALPAPLAHP